MKKSLLFITFVLLNAHFTYAACTTEQIKTVLNSYTDNQFAACSQNVSFGASTGNSLYFVQVKCDGTYHQFGVTVNENDNNCETSLLNDLLGRTVVQYR